MSWLIPCLDTSVSSLGHLYVSVLSCLDQISNVSSRVSKPASWPIISVSETWILTEYLLMFVMFYNYVLPHVLSKLI